VPGERDVEPCELRFDTICFGTPRHCGRTHDRRAVLEYDGAIRRRRFVGIVSVRIEDDRLDAVVAQRLLQHGVLFDGPRIDDAGFARHRARAFDAWVRRDQQRATQPPRRRTDEPRSEMNATVCHGYRPSFRARYAPALQTRRRRR
jgi:hypothetical protein